MSLNGTVWALIGPSPIDQGAISANEVRSPRSPSTRTTPRSFISAQPGGGVWLTNATGVILGRRPSIERLHWASATRARLRSIQLTRTLCMLEPRAAEGSAVLRRSHATAGRPLQSTDSGASWIRLGLGYPPGPPSNASIFFSQLITAVIVDPANTQTVYLASNAGLFVSTDGGLQLDARACPQRDVRLTVARTRTSPGSSHFVCWRQRRWRRSIHLTADSTGRRFLMPPTPAVSAALAGGGFGKVVVALAPPAAVPNPAGIQVLYATMVGTGSAPNTVGLFQSTIRARSGALEPPRDWRE